MSDQKEIYAYLKKRMPAEESRNALYRVASLAKDAGWNFMEASFQLGDKAVEDGLSKEAAEATIRKAFARERRKAERTEGAAAPAQVLAESPKSPGDLELDEESLELLQSRRINPDALSIPFPSDTWRKDLLKLLTVAFHPDDIIEFKKAGTDEVSKEKVSVILGQTEGINKIMRAFDCDDGAMMCINAVSSEDPDEKDSCLYRYALVDSPTMSLSKQLAYYKALNLPCVALVNSGANSVQAWVKIDAIDSNEYTDRVDFLYSILEDQGFRVDHMNKTPSQMVWMPGVLRSGKQQYLISTNEGVNSWKEWEEWVEYCLDGDPLAEMASYHNAPPTQEAPLVSGILRPGQSLVIQAPPKSCKSHMLAELAYSISYGREWLGQNVLAGDVLYVNLDQDKNTFINRLHRVAEALNVKPDTPRLGFFHLKAFPKSGIEFAQFIAKRIRGARKYEDRNYKAVIIDPITKLVPPTITSDSSASALIRQISDHITATSGAAVISAISSGTVRDVSWCDSLLNFHHQNESDAYILNGSFRDFPSLGPVECRWTFPLLQARRR